MPITIKSLQRTSKNKSGRSKLPMTCSDRKLKSQKLEEKYGKKLTLSPYSSPSRSLESNRISTSTPSATVQMPASPIQETLPKIQSTLIWRMTNHVLPQPKRLE